MPVDAFSVAAGSDDCFGEYTGAASWPANGGTFASQNFGADYTLKSDDGATYSHAWMMMRWDTSSIPDGDAISAAQLKVYSWELFDGDASYSLVADWYDYGGNPAVAGDWIETPSPSIFTPIRINLLTTGSVKTIDITDFSGINKTGFTGIRLGLSSGTPTAVNFIRFIAFDDATEPEPQLVVTHGAGAPSDDPPLGFLGRGAGW